MSHSNFARQVMRDAINRFAQEEKVEPQKIAIGVCPVLPEYSPKYFYLVDGKPKLDESGQKRELHYRKEILKSKVDFTQSGPLLKVFLQHRFKVFTQIHDTAPENISLRVELSGRVEDDVDIKLFKGDEQVAIYNIDEMFAMS